jgi:hypothetical protein
MDQPRNGGSFDVTFVIAMMIVAALVFGFVAGVMLAAFASEHLHLGSHMQKTVEVVVGAALAIVCGVCAYLLRNILILRPRRYVSNRVP